MKIKMIILAVSLIGINYLTANCNKNEVIKMIDKGFSKLEIQNICGFSKKPKTEWMTPSKSVCINFGGKISKGACKAKFKNAKDICYDIVGRLPRLEELKQVIVDGRGIIDDNDNINNSSYQSYYKKKGFKGSDLYWSNVYPPNNYGEWVVDFAHGTAIWNGMSKDSFYVRCVKGRVI